jgi:hypothetical protein
MLTLPRLHTHTHSHIPKYVILIAFPRQELFRERASILRVYIACLVLYSQQQTRNYVNEMLFPISFRILEKFEFFENILYPVIFLPDILSSTLQRVLRCVIYKDFVTF